MTISTDLTASLRSVVETFDRLGIDYYVTGSVASSIHGAVRATNDIDIVARFPLTEAGPFFEAVQGQHYVDLKSIKDAIRLKRSFNVVHLTTAFKLDIFVSAESSHDLQVFKRTRIMRIDPAQPSFAVKVVSPEDLIIAKLQWFDRGGRVSHQQLEDIRGIWKVQPHIDRDYLEKRASVLGLLDLLRSSFP